MRWKTYSYFLYILEKMLENERNINEELLKSIMSWSPDLPSELKQKKKEQ